MYTTRVYTCRLLILYIHTIVYACRAHMNSIHRAPEGTQLSLTIGYGFFQLLIFLCQSPYHVFKVTNVVNGLLKHSGLLKLRMKQTHKVTWSSITNFSTWIYTIHIQDIGLQLGSYQPYMNLANSSLYLPVCCPWSVWTPFHVASRSCR